MAAKAYKLNWASVRNNSNSWNDPSQVLESKS